MKRGGHGGPPRGPKKHPGDAPKRHPADAQKRHPADAQKRRPGPGPSAKAGSANAPAAKAPAAKAPAAKAPPAKVPLKRGKPLPGTWLLTTRPGAETDLVDELELSLGKGRARIVGPSLVESTGAPTFEDGELDLTFARQGFAVAAHVVGAEETLGASVAEAIASSVADGEFALLVWVPDHDATNPLAPRVEALEAAIASALPEPLAKRRIGLRALEGRGGTLVQVALVAPGEAYVGGVESGLAISRAPGGRARMKLGADRPSRAARKVEEALAWLGDSPGPGELCVDLGAAPGGWTWVLLEKRAHVIAVDPAKLRPDLMQRKGLRHVMDSAFTFVPDEPIDWLFCDMAWRPLEVAQLLAKWGRRRWARTLVANVKLPMKKKAEMVEEVRAIVASGGWTRIRTRQLYHDREEITMTARLPR
ncbi:MAG: 23S rRNA (cytidine(2498)-2'-O)-methyltransferase RlmM [Polyangiales bacterium]